MSLFVMMTRCIDINTIYLTPAIYRPSIKHNGDLCLSHSGKSQWCNADVSQNDLRFLMPL